MGGGAERCPTCRAPNCRDMKPGFGSNVQYAQRAGASGYYLSQELFVIGDGATDGVVAGLCKPVRSRCGGHQGALDSVGQRGCVADRNEWPQSTAL